MQVLAMAIHTAKRFGEIGFVIGAIGALMMAAGSMPRGRSAGVGGAPIVAIGAVLVAAGFVLGIVSLHWG